MERGRRLRAAVEAFGRDVVDPADYTAEAFPVIKAAAATQSAGFAQLGPLLSFQLIADDTLVSEVVQYRARYQNAVIHYRFV